MAPPVISLIVPTRGRCGPLRRFLASVAATAARPDRLEIVLVIDDDDPASAAVAHPRLTVRHVAGLPGRTMGALNTAGYDGSSGEYVMLANDDVVVRTRGWDETARRCIERFPDRLALIHVNDTLMRDHLCVFPFVSRRFCELAGGVCPAEYERYRIDDHIEDVFNLVNALGERRVVYLPDVRFEHLNAVVHPTAGRVYQSEPGALARDAARFEALLPARKELALRIMRQVECARGADGSVDRAATLDAVADSLALRVPGRQLVVRAGWWERAPGAAAGLFRRAVARVRTRYRLEGVGGLLRAAGRQCLGRREAARRDS